MKGYEAKARLTLPRRTLAAIRIDGRAFHTWTRGLERPYSTEMLDAMAATTVALCEEVSGSVFAYTQSDEISILVQDFAKADTQPWFGGSVQKVCSVAASVATAHFARLFPDRPPAFFDARVFPLSSRVEAVNYLVWRQRDAVRNAVSMLAGHHFSSKSLHGLSNDQRYDKLAAHGVDVSAHDPRFLHGQSPESLVEVADPLSGRDPVKEEVETPEPVASPFVADPDYWPWDEIPDLPEPLCAAPPTEGAE
jgi:tRNA(His) 5'-end guanylyltransferase